MLSKEAFQGIELVRPRSDITVPVFGNEVTPMELYRDLIRNPRDKRWYFGTGDPEFWRFSSKLIVQEGKALDLGSHLGRSSVPFALRGMNVEAYEVNPDFARALDVVARNFDLPISVQNQDVRTSEFGVEEFDTVILGQMFGHFESREEAFKVIDKAIAALKPGGRIWFRGNGKRYDIEQQTQSLNGNREHYMNDCDCSGKMRIEPHLFFDPVELVSHIGKGGINIVHMQMGEMVVIPKEPKEEQRKRPNIMYGEDWEPDREHFDETVSIEDLFGESIQKPHRTDHVITIIGQKKNNEFLQ